jgi:hypothetical protein
VLRRRELTSTVFALICAGAYPGSGRKGTAAVVRCLIPGVLILNMSRAALHRACIQAEIALKHQRKQTRLQVYQSI